MAAKGTKKKMRRGERVIQAGNREAVPCTMAWLEENNKDAAMMRIKKKGRMKEKNGSGGGGGGGGGGEEVEEAMSAGEDMVMDVASACGFRAAGVAVRVPNDHSVRLGFPSPPANPFWRFRLFLDRLYVPAMGSEDARTLRCNALELARKSRLAKATPQYRRWLQFKAKGFRDYLSIEQVQTPADFEEIFLQKDEHVQEVARRRRHVRRSSDGRSALETAVASREVPLLGMLLPILRQFDFKFKLHCDEAKLRGRLAHKYFCRNDKLKMETELLRRRLYNDVLDVGENAALAVDLTPLRSLPIRSFAKTYGARLKRGMIRLGASRERAEEKVNDLMDYFTVGALNQLPLRGKYNLQGKEELAAVLKFYEELDSETQASVRAASDAKTATEEQQQYFSTMIGSESMASDEELYKQQNKRMPQVVPDLDLIRDTDGDLYFPSESKRTARKLKKDAREFRENIKKQILKGWQWVPSMDRTLGQSVWFFLGMPAYHNPPFLPEYDRFRLNDYNDDGYLKKFTTQDYYDDKREYEKENAVVVKKKTLLEELKSAWKYVTEGPPDTKKMDADRRKARMTLSAEKKPPRKGKKEDEKKDKKDDDDDETLRGRTATNRVKGKGAQSVWEHRFRAMLANLVIRDSRARMRAMNDAKITAIKEGRSKSDVNKILSNIADGRKINLETRDGHLSDVALDAAEEFKDTLAYNFKKLDSMHPDNLYHGRKIFEPDINKQYGYEKTLYHNKLKSYKRHDGLYRDPYPWEIRDKKYLSDVPVPVNIAEFDGITSSTFDDDAKYLRSPDAAQASGSVGGVVAISRTTTTEDEKLWSRLGAVHGAQDEISVAMQNVSQTMNNDIPHSPYTRTPEAEDPYWKSSDPEAQQLAIERADLVSATDDRKKLQKTCVSVAGSCFTKFGGYLSAKWEPDHRLVIDYVMKDTTKRDIAGDPKEIRVPICMVRDEYLCKSFFGLFIGPDAMDGGSKRKVGRTILKVLNGKSMLTGEDGLDEPKALPLSLGVFSLTSSVTGTAAGGVGAGNIFVLDGIARMKQSSPLSRNLRWLGG